MPSPPTRSTASPSSSSPSLTFAAAIVDNADGLSVKPSGQTIYAFAAILLISSAFLSFAGWAARRSMRKYTLAAR